MTRTYRKNILRTITGSMGRFISIMLIIFLGVGFVAGLRLTRPVMIEVEQNYINKHRMFDLRLISNIGLDEDDVKAADALDGVEDAIGSYSHDFVTMLGDKEVVLHAMALTDEVNTPELVSGRMPEKDNEILMDAYKSGESMIGQTITLSDSNDEDTLDFFTYDEYVVTGLARSVMYFSAERGTSSLGDGSVYAFVYMPEGGFTSDYFTEIYVRTGTEYEVYSDAYKDDMEELSDRMEDALLSSVNDRYNRLVDDARDEISDAKETLATEKADAEQELADAWEKLEDGRKELEDGEKLLKIAENELYKARIQLEDSEKQLDDAKKQLDDATAGYASWNDCLSAGRSEVSAGQAKLNAEIAQLESGRTQLENAESEYNAGLAQYNAGESAYSSGVAQYNAGEGAYSTALAQYNAGEAAYAAGAAMMEEEEAAAMRAQLDAAAAQLQQNRAVLDATAAQLQQSRATLDATAAQLQEGRAALDAQWEAFNAAVAEAQPAIDEAQAELDAATSQLNGLESGINAYNSGYAAWQKGRRDYGAGYASYQDALQKLVDGRKEYDDGLQEYYDGVAELEEKVSDAEEDIAKAERDLEKLADPSLYVLDRSSVTAYATFESDSAIVENIARVFPIFFFLIAALVCSTTMTRMVDDDRTHIGTLRALGYSRGAILWKYLLYSGLAAVLGSLGGYFALGVLFPQVIWIAYRMLYLIQDTTILFNPVLLALLMAAALLCSTGTTYLACRREMRDMPAELIRPRTPPAGKRILLERITFLWRRLKFLHKVSLRNIFRYKKRMIMMIMGIAGCTALVLTALGIYDSVADICDIQYDRILHYDLSLTTFEPFNDAAKKDIENLGGESIAESAVVQSYAADIQFSDTTRSCQMVITDAENITDFITLRHNGESVAWPKKGEIVMTERLGEQLKANVGDRVTIKLSDTEYADFTVSGLVENYVYNYVYMTAESFEDSYERSYEPKTVYISLTEDADDHAAGAALAGSDEVLSVTVITDFRNTISRMMQSLNYVVAVVLASAAGLAFIVLFNLGNINISERVREIATIKVLGFHRRETHSYVFRENFILSCIGVVLGLPLGKVLHMFVIDQIAVDMVSFASIVNVRSYFITVALVLLFTYLSDLMLRPKLHRINMAESLKSVE